MCSSPPTFRCTLVCPGVLDRGAFVELWIFTGCKLKGRDKESVSCHYDGDVTPLTKVVIREKFIALKSTLEKKKGLK